MSGWNPHAVAGGRARWRALGAAAVLAGAAVLLAVSAGGSQDLPAGGPGAKGAPAAEAPAGFDDQTNGLEDQAAFDKDREAFEEEETVLPDKAKNKKGGLGPVYNATS